MQTNFISAKDRLAIIDELYADIFSKVDAAVEVAISTTGACSQLISVHNRLHRRVKLRKQQLQQWMQSQLAAGTEDEPNVPPDWASVSFGKDLALFLELLPPRAKALLENSAPHNGLLILDNF